MDDKPSARKSRELPTDRLATTDTAGRRVYLYPSEVRGVFQRRRQILQHLLVFIFLGLPWLRIGGKQAFLIDLSARRFHLFGITLWAHETPLLLIVFIAFVAMIAWVTAKLGRVWCGWACPQTVFIERWFRSVERLIEGDSVARRRLDEAPLDAGKAFKKIAKWTAFLVLSGIITHSVLALFVGSDRVLEFISTSPAENPTPFIFILISTAILLFDFGWFREQFCIIACPYGRMQSALMDSGSLAIRYDEKRGEPRGAGGDCVNCYRCVQVCPTGVDIRRGVQLECVACTACADACDSVMERLHKPLGLIRYARETEFDPAAPAPNRARPWVYASVVIAAVASAGAWIAGRAPVRNSLLRTHGIPAVEKAADGSEWISNSFQWVIENQSDRALLVVVDEEAARKAMPGIEIQAPQENTVLEPNARQTRPLWIRVPRNAFTDRSAAFDLPVKLSSPSDAAQSAPQPFLAPTLLIPVRLLGPLPKRLPD